LVHPRSSFPVVEGTDHDIEGREGGDPEALDGDGMRDGGNFGIQQHCLGGQDNCLERAFVVFAEERTPGEVRVLDCVHVDDLNVAYSDERQVLHNLVTQRPSPHHENARALKFALIPPRNEFLPVVSSICLVKDGHRRD
jgi:hypothetical protein